MLTQWKDMESAPQNRPIILDVGLPWAVYGVYNSLSMSFIYADLTMDTHTKDTYFNNEYEKKPLRWHELPKIR